MAKAGRRQQAQGELLSTTGAIPVDDDSLKKQVGQMLIDYGLPKAAGNLFRDVAQRNKQDAGALEGLADAEFANGEYAAARDAYREPCARSVNAAIAKRADFVRAHSGAGTGFAGLGARKATRGF